LRITKLKKFEIVFSVVNNIADYQFKKVLVVDIYA